MKNINKKTESDETLRFLEERNNDFLERIKSYGFNSLEEYQLAEEKLFRYQNSRSLRYPVGSDC